MYLLGGVFFKTADQWIFIIIVSSLDFWTVKNVSGRYLLKVYEKFGKNVS